MTAHSRCCCCNINSFPPAGVWEGLEFSLQLALLRQTLTKPVTSPSARAFVWQMRMIASALMVLVGAGRTQCLRLATMPCPLVCRSLVDLAEIHITAERLPTRNVSLHVVATEANGLRFWCCNSSEPVAPDSRLSCHLLAECNACHSPCAQHLCKALCSAAAAAAA
jgi:hypothetical protein